MGNTSKLAEMCNGADTFQQLMAKLVEHKLQCHLLLPPQDFYPHSSNGKIVPRSSGRFAICGPLMPVEVHSDYSLLSVNISQQTVHAAHYHISPYLLILHSDIENLLSQG